MNLPHDKNSRINKEFQKSVKVKKILRLKKVLNEKSTSHFKVENNSYHFVILQSSDTPLAQFLFISLDQWKLFLGRVICGVVLHA